MCILIEQGFPSAAKAAKSEDGFIGTAEAVPFPFVLIHNP
jgi:hypothetical protein